MEKDTNNRETTDSLHDDFTKAQFDGDKQESFEIVNTLAMLYTTIFLMDVETHSYHVIKSVPMMQDVMNGRRNGNFDEIFNSVIWHFVHPDMHASMRTFLDISTVRERLMHTSTVSTEFKGVNGHWFVARFVVQKRDENDEAVNVLYVSRDITIEKEKEMHYLERLKTTATEAERANLSKTNFLRRMSHDIRTPLNGIIGMLKVMDEHEGNPYKYRECMDKLMRSSDYLLSLVNNVLDIGKMESGEIELEYRPFDLYKLLYNTMPIIENYAGQNSVIFIGGVEDVHITHTHVVGSPVHLNRILMNIASNAIKYNHSGGSLRVCCNELKCDGKQAIYEFICEDTGLGMSPDFQKHAFDPFTREGKPTTTSFTGSGLGLAIVKNIVDKMGGFIELESREDIGTTIRVTLALSLDEHPEAFTDDVNALEAIDLSGRRAILVEDNEINMDIASIILESMGLSITCAWNGQEAIETFEAADAYTYDFIFMDMMMPVMDGLTATRRLRALKKPDAATIPIIAMTANAFAEDRKACLDAGMNDHIAKPIDNRQLVRVLRRFVE